jgi:hypothetical protein
LVRKNFNSKLDLIFNFRVGMRLKEPKKKNLKTPYHLKNKILMITTGS